MNFKDNLIKYKEYSQGDISKKCIIEYEDIDILSFDFSKYDLNNSYFGGVNFEKCNFSNVYLSGSNFGGSFFKDCIFRENVINKAAWDDIVFEKTKILSMSALRTTFMFGKFQDSYFAECYFEKSSFANSEFKNVEFRECTIIDSDFTECKFEMMQFIKCKLHNVKFDKNADNQIVIIN